MDSMAKYLSEMDQEQVEKSTREQLAFEKELFEQKLKFGQEKEGRSSSNTNQNTNLSPGKPIARHSSKTAEAYD